MKQQPTNKKQPAQKAIVKKRKEEVIERVEGEVISDREAPIERSRLLREDSVIGPVFNKAQLRILLNQTPKWAIKVRQGRGGNYKYVPHGYVTDTLNQAFGFDWDLIINNIDGEKKYALIYEDIFDNRGTKIRTDRHLAVEGHIVVRITVNGETHQIIKHGFGSQLWLPGAELGDALKGARSDLVKTCAYQLGVALDLYWNERAEFDKWDIAEKKSASSQLIAQITSGTPTTPVALLSRAMSEYQMDGEEVALAVGQDFEDIMVMGEDGIKKVWNELEKLKSKEKKK